MREQSTMSPAMKHEGKVDGEVSKTVWATLREESKLKAHETHRIMKGNALQQQSFSKVSNLKMLKDSEEGDDQKTWKIPRKQPTGLKSLCQETSSLFS